MFTGNDPAQRTGQGHDASHGGIGLLQHFVMIGIDRQVGVNIAVACMHVQGHEHPPAQNFLVYGFDAFRDRAEIVALKNFL